MAQDTERNEAGPHPFPQVLLLGNGLNLTYNAGNWSKLIEDIASKQQVNAQALKNAPFPLQAVLATGDHVNAAIQRESKEAFSVIYGLRDIEPLRGLMESLLDIPFDHILTTNYSYEIERTANPKVDASGTYCKKLMRHTKTRSKAESRYLIHTYNEIAYHGKVHRVWHIHGEARKPSGVVLGHYYYGQLLGECQNVLKDRGNEQYRHQLEGKPPVIESWLDAFIMGDVYVLGFGFDFSEMDLWWLLNRKKRENAAHGTLHFYNPASDKHDVKCALLKTCGAEVKDLGFQKKDGEDDCYLPFYQAAIADIRRCVERAKQGDPPRL